MTVENWIAFSALLLSVCAAIGATFWRIMAVFDQFKTHVEAIYLRKNEYNIAQRNTDRRLESIESKVDKIPESLDRQSERLIAVLKETRQ